MTRGRLALVGSVLVVLLAACDWTGYLADPDHSSFSPDRGITQASVTALQELWRWRPDGSDPSRPGGILATPVTWRGKVFIGANNGFFVALDETTGTVLWSRDFGYQPAITCPAEGIVSTAAVRDDGNGNPLVYLNSPDGYLYELDGDTGDTVWRSVVQIPSTTQNDSLAWSSPTVANGKVYVGISSSCDMPLVQGELAAYDQETGALVATYKSVPDGSVGAGIWTSAAATSDAVYVTTGSVDDNDPPPGDQYSIVKLDPDTLAELGAWRLPIPAVIGDADFGSSPVVFTATIDRTPVQMVGACNKSGTFYAVRTDTMQLVWQRTVGTPTSNGPAACLSGGVWDGKHLFVAGNATVIGGTQVPGSVRRLNPATGGVVWARALGANPLGAGTINANGILAYTTTDWTRTLNATYLIRASTGRILATLPNAFPGFSQPIWVDGKLLDTTTDSIAAYG